MIRITEPLHYLYVEVEEMTIGGSDRDFFQPREMPCSLYPGNFCDLFLTCSGLFSLFRSCLPHGLFISHQFRKPRGLRPTLKNFAVRLIPVIGAGYRSFYK